MRDRAINDMDKEYDKKLRDRGKQIVRELKYKFLGRGGRKSLAM